VLQVFLPVRHRRFSPEQVSAIIELQSFHTSDAKVVRSVMRTVADDARRRDGHLLYGFDGPILSAITAASGATGSLPDWPRAAKAPCAWFYGFKLHVVLNHKGQVMAVKITRANVNDRHPVKAMTKGLEGIIAADKGYLSKNSSMPYTKKVLSCSPVSGEICEIFSCP
jgi:hypothetical protein